MREVLNYLFGPVTGSSLTTEPFLFGILLTFVAGLLFGIVAWLRSRAYRHSNPLAARQLHRLGNWLTWTSLFALLIAGFFYEEAIFNRRWVMVALLLLIYAVVGYAIYFLLARYPELERRQQQEREKRRKYIPAPHTLGRGRANRSERRRGKASR